MEVSHKVTELLLCGVLSRLPRTGALANKQILGPSGRKDGAKRLASGEGFELSSNGLQRGKSKTATEFQSVAVSI